MDVLLEENPRLEVNSMKGMYDFNPYGFNPRRRRRKSRNPTIAIPGVKKWSQGVDLMDVAGGVAGLAAATMVPGMIIKDTTTATQKFMKVLAAVAAALGVGYIAREVISPSAGKAAIIGGLAGTGSQVIGMTTGLTIGGPRRILLSPGRRIGGQEVVSPATAREAEVVSIIQP